MLFNSFVCVCLIPFCRRSPLEARVCTGMRGREWAQAWFWTLGLVSAFLWKDFPAPYCSNTARVCDNPTQDCADGRHAVGKDLALHSRTGGWDVPSFPQTTGAVGLIEDGVTGTQNRSQRQLTTSDRSGPPGKDGTSGGSYAKKTSGCLVTESRWATSSTSW